MHIAVNLLGFHGIAGEFVAVLVFVNPRASECIGEVIVCRFVSYQRCAEGENEQGTQQKTKRFVHGEILLFVAAIAAGFSGFNLELR